jgi:hypothetical protein
MYGERYGVTMFTMVTNLNITVLEVPKLQKKYPEMAITPHFAEAYYSVGIR